MIKSMTGFGRYEQTNGSKKFSVEIKSVNHRYIDLNIKLPRKFNAYEPKIRNLLKKDIHRGKIDIYIYYEDVSKKDVSVQYNKEIAREYYNNLKEMSNDFSLENDIRVGMLSRYPEVFTMEEVREDEEELWPYFEKTIIKACEQLMESRIKEGENLKKDLMNKLDLVLENVAFIESKSPELIRDYKNGLRAKINELIDDTTIDESRLLMEVTIFADKVCVDEELVRLRSHLKTMKQAILEGECNIGRKLDFLAQEMNREANTILSKTTNLEVSEHAIDLKAEIEKIREQIQNIE